MKNEVRQQKRLKIVETLQDMLMAADKAGDPDLVVILQKQIKRAKMGDLDSAKFLLDRAFGTPTQMIAMKSQSEQTININLIEKKHGTEKEK